LSIVEETKSNITEPNIHQEDKDIITPKKIKARFSCLTTSASLPRNRANPILIVSGACTGLKTIVGQNVTKIVNATWSENF